MGEKRCFFVLDQRVTLICSQTIIVQSMHNEVCAFEWRGVNQCNIMQHIFAECCIG